jgi:glycosyltransferase involved in cell wall biosynthesis
MVNLIPQRINAFDSQINSMRAEPHFSVIIPTYHEESSIGNTLSSIKRAGNGHAIETIVVDGGSMDRTLDIARRHDSRIHTLEMRGIGLARNYGAIQSRGDILVFLDSDTAVPENFFDELSAVFSDPLVCGANCNVMPSQRYSPTWKEKTFYRLWGKTRKLFYHLRPCGTGDNGIIVRREAFEKAGGFNEDMSTMEDLDFVFRASSQGRFLLLKSLTLTESMRRIRRKGILRFSAIYVCNFFYYLLRKRPRISRWEPVR